MTNNSCTYINRYPRDAFKQTGWLLILCAALGMARPGDAQPLILPETPGEVLSLAPDEWRITHNSSFSWSLLKLNPTMPQKVHLAMRVRLDHKETGSFAGILRMMINSRPVTLHTGHGSLRLLNKPSQIPGTADPALPWCMLDGLWRIYYALDFNSSPNEKPAKYMYDFVLDITDMLKNDDNLIRFTHAGRSGIVCDTAREAPLVFRDLQLVIPTDKQPDMPVP